MIASVHIADVGAGRVPGTLRRAPKPAKVEGLRDANLALAAPLTASLLGRPQVGRVALLAFWDDDEALDRFEASDPVAERLAGGWHARLRPLRMFGAWPGVPDDLPSARSVDDDGPVVVLTLGWLRLSQLPRFLRASAKAEGSALEAKGFVWGSGLARPPFVATCSLWESGTAAATYAYGRRNAGHPDAIASGEAKAFHKRQAFIRFEPYQAGGSLGGRNPLAGLPEGERTPDS